MDQYIVTGMTCAACQAHVEKAVSKVPGVTSVNVSLLTNSMAVQGTAKSAEIIRAVENAGYGAQIKGTASAAGASAKLAADEDALKDRETPKLKRRLALSVGFLVVLMYITMGHNMLGLPLPAFLTHNHIGLAITQMLIAIIVMVINGAFFTSGFRTLFRGAPNMDTLVAMGSGVSFAWSLIVLFRMTVLIVNGTDNMDLMGIYHDQLYFESAAMIPALITVGKTLEALSKGRTTDALRNLMKMAPKTAVLEKDGQQVEVGIDEVLPGDIFVVRPGESVPVDGVIIEGATAVDESALTGESIPVDKSAGDTVSAATINQSGFIKAKASRVGEDTTFSQIIRMVSDAAATKAPIARIADKVSGVFVPAVIAIAAVVTVVWIIAGRDLAYALERGISVLVVSCPCALGLATPVAIMVGNGIGAKNGILFKTSESLETAGKTQIVALDKTGTITEGRPEVTDLIPAAGITQTELLRLAYALEKRSEHPLARAVVKRGEEEGLEVPEATDFTALAGNGLTAKVDGTELYGGSATFISSRIEVPDVFRRRADELADQGKTPLFFERDGSLIGIIAVADVIKADSAEAIGELRNMGIEVVMLTGDNEKTAKAIGAQAGVDNVIAGVLPDGKEAVIRNLQARGKVAMVGDGINDAPALTRADTGIAIGAGTDVAIDSADIVLMNSRLSDVAAAIRLSRATLRDIRQNLFWAFAYNAALIPMAAGLYPGIRMNPMWGAAAMALSSVTVCLNALRLNLFPVHDASRDRPMRKKAQPGDCTEISEKPSAEIACASGKTCPMAQPAEKEAVISVAGMMCEHCERRVSDALTKLDGIDEARADHLTGKVRIIYSGAIDEEKVRKAVADAGYEYNGIGAAAKTATVLIEGMMCTHCEATVKKALEKLDGVEKAEVSYESGTAVLTLSAEVPEAAIRRAVENEDYKFIEVQ